MENNPETNRQPQIDFEGVARSLKGDQIDPKLQKMLPDLIQALKEAEEKLRSGERYAILDVPREYPEMDWDTVRQPFASAVRDNNGGSELGIFQQNDKIILTDKETTRYQVMVKREPF